MSPIPPEYHVGQHHHDPMAFEIPRNVAPAIMVGLLVMPILWKIYINKKTKAIP